MRYLFLTLLSVLLSSGILINPAFAQEPAAEGVTIEVNVEEVVEAPVAEEPAAPVVEEAPAEGGEDAAEPVEGEEAEEAPVVPVEEAKVPETDEAAGKLIGDLLDAAQNGHWTVFGGALMLLMVWFFNRLGLAAKIGRKYVPWVTVGISTLVAVGVGLAEGAAIIDSVKLGLLEGGIAIALWELVVKQISAKKSDGTPREA